VASVTSSDGGLFFRCWPLWSYCSMRRLPGMRAFPWPCVTVPMPPPGPPAPSSLATPLADHRQEADFCVSGSAGPEFLLDGPGRVAWLRVGRPNGRRPTGPHRPCDTRPASGHRPKNHHLVTSISHVLSPPGWLRNSGVESPSRRRPAMEIHSTHIPTSVKPTPERVAELDRLGDAIAELSRISRPPPRASSTSSASSMPAAAGATGSAPAPLAELADRPRPRRVPGEGPRGPRPWRRCRSWPRHSPAGAFYAKGPGPDPRRDA